MIQWKNIINKKIYFKKKKERVAQSGWLLNEDDWQRLSRVKGPEPEMEKEKSHLVAKRTNL